MMLVGDLEEWLGLTLPPTLVWDYPSIAAIADFLLEQLRMEAVAGPDADGLAASPVDGLAALDGLSDREVDELLGRMLASQGPWARPTAAPGPAMINPKDDRRSRCAFHRS